MTAVSADSIIRQGYAYVAAGRVPELFARMSEDILVRQAHSLPFGGERRVKEAFAEMARRIYATWPDFSVTPIAITTDSAEQVVVVARNLGFGGMPAFDYPTATTPTAPRPPLMPKCVDWPGYPRAGHSLASGY